MFQKHFKNIPNMFQKHPDGHYGVLRLENDANKTYGHTYWGFAFSAANFLVKARVFSFLSHQKPATKIRP